jgi:hypothetical protein
MGGLLSQQGGAARLIGTVCLDEQLRPGLVTKTDGSTWAGVALSWHQEPGRRWLTVRPVPVARTLREYVQHTDDQLGLVALWQRQMQVMLGRGGMIDCQRCGRQQGDVHGLDGTGGMIAVLCLACGEVVEYWGQMPDGAAR